MSDRAGWWTPEFWGKYMHAAMPFWSATHNPELKAKIDASLQNVLASQEPSGYIGIYPEDLRFTNWDVWGMKYTILGLMH